MVLYLSADYTFIFVFYKILALMTELQFELCRLSIKNM